MNLLLFRKQVQTALTDLLGTYTFPNGSSTPAIEIREGNESLDFNTSVEGLEVTIEASSPESSFSTYEGTPQWYKYDVHLIQWSGSNLLEAVTRLRAMYDKSTGYPINVPADEGPSRQYLITVISENYYSAPYKMHAP